MNRSVSQLLAEQHGVSIKPGAKGECPYCHHRTFSVKHDDSLGKCFHPLCGRFLTVSGRDSLFGTGLFEVFQGIFIDFHRELLNLAEADYKNAYSYLVVERNIHPKVVADSMLGAIPSSGYDLDEKFAAIMQRLEQKSELESKTPRGSRGRPRKGTRSAKESLEFAIEIKEKLV